MSERRIPASLFIYKNLLMRGDSVVMVNEQATQELLQKAYYLVRASLRNGAKLTDALLSILGGGYDVAKDAGKKTRDLLFDQPKGRQVRKRKFFNLTKDRDKIPVAEADFGALKKELKRRGVDFALDKGEDGVHTVWFEAKNRDLVEESIKRVAAMDAAEKETAAKDAPVEDLDDPVEEAERPKTMTLGEALDPKTCKEIDPKADSRDLDALVRQAGRNGADIRIFKDEKTGDIQFLIGVNNPKQFNKFREKLAANEVGLEGIKKKIELKQELIRAVPKAERALSHGEVSL